jgi:hypothetical protein
VEQCFVALIGEGGKQAALEFGGRREQLQALVGMGCQHDGVKTFLLSRRGCHHSCALIFRDRDDRVCQLGRTEDIKHLGEVTARSPFNGEPWVMCRHPEETMVVEKMEKSGSWEIKNASRFGRPDGRTHRNEVEIEEMRTKAVAFAESREILAVKFRMFPGGVARRLDG